MGISPLGDNLTAGSDVRSGQEVRSNEVDRTQTARLERSERGRESGDDRDTVSLSFLGAELARSLATEAPEEVGRINELQQAVNNGTLRASSEEIAARVIEEALGGTQIEKRSPPAPS
jgi:anti-sigma28 factor (negative regulator of flagellin synthesis)